ncbi:MAG: serine hydrolase [Desulfobacteraceae bacterium]|jgi:CubicO group peptidase (beta-lactamase class C family)|nr:serine hydrolase [Desulfobacteraceae bacterium]
MGLPKKHTPGVLILSAIFLAAIFAGCERQKSDAPGIPIQGAVYHVHRDDGSHKTYLDVDVGRSFSGKLPDDIDAITVTGPYGVLPIGKDDFNYDPQSRAFRIVRPGIPEIGEYSFKVVSGNSAGVASDIQTTIKTLPLADVSQFNPARYQTDPCQTHTFSWSPLNEPDDLFYQLQIRDLNRKQVYGTDYVRDMVSIRIPPDILEPGKMYQWRVRVADGPNWIALNNRSQSRWVPFSTAQQLKPCEYRYQVPSELNDGWDVSSLTHEGVDPNRITAMMNGILADDLPNIHSVLLIKNGKLVLEEYFNGYSREIKPIIASVTKSITSILIGIALDRQMIGSIDQRVYEFFPEYKGTRWIDRKYDITVEHVLTMAAGVDWDEITFLHPDHRNPNTLMYTSDHPIGYVLDKKQLDPPGSRWRYNSGLTVLLGGILKNATGLYADEFAGQYLFNPMGITDYLWLKHPDGTIYAHGDLFLKPRDMAKIGYLMLNQGKWQNKQIVSQEWVKASTRKHIETYRGYGYGYQWRCGKTLICDQEIEAFWASGTGGQKIYVFPKLDLIVVFTSKIFGNSSGHERNESLLAKFIIPAVVSPGYQPKVIKLDDRVLDTYAGEYAINHEKVLIPEFMKKVRFMVFREGSKLFIKTPDGQIVRLVPESDDRFFGIFKDIGQAQFRSIRDEHGAIKQVSRHIGFRTVLLDKVR